LNPAEENLAIRQEQRDRFAKSAAGLVGKDFTELDSDSVTEDYLAYMTPGRLEKTKGNLQKDTLQKIESIIGGQLTAQNVSTWQDSWKKTASLDQLTSKDKASRLTSMSSADIADLAESGQLSPSVLSKLSP